MDTNSYIATQDSLRPFRMFVGAVTGALYGSNDQSMAGFDGNSYNNPYQYQSVGPYGVSVEGAGLPISPTAGGGLYISPMVVLIGLGAAAMLFLKR
jgi:hypothetical protein